MATKPTPPPGKGYYSPWQRPTVWKSWFAWYPVKVKGHWQWMKKVYRCKPWSIFSHHTRWKYGDIFDVLTSNTEPAVGQKPPKPPPRVLNY